MSCILPWINFGTNIYGRPRVCGYSNINAQWKHMFEKRGLPWPPTKIEDTPKEILESDFAKEFQTWNGKLEKHGVKEQWNNIYFREIRETFLNGEWPANCGRCKHVEELGGKSKRIDENDMWHDENLIAETEYPKHIDVRTGTVCNFKCIHCSPNVSSKWVEDKEVAIKYGTEYVENDNTWIAKDNDFWNQLDISQIKRYNFLGGESFYNKRHNEFIKKLNESEYANEIEIAYVTNGSFRFENMENFKKVRLRLSVDCVETAGEYFRYGLKWDDWCENIKKFPSNFDASFQWTCSNVSMFYLVDTYKLLRKQFPDIRFLFENHVTEPYYMSAQNLPSSIKEKISDEIDFEIDPFYVNYMFKKDGWSEKGETFINYLNDLDKARKTNWRKSLCGLEKALSGLTLS
mgnify:FL=1